MRVISQSQARCLDARGGGRPPVGGTDDDQVHADVRSRVHRPGTAEADDHVGGIPDDGGGERDDEPDDTEINAVTVSRNAQCDDGRDKAQDTQNELAHPEGLGLPNLRPGCRVEDHNGR